MPSLSAVSHGVRAFVLGEGVPTVCLYPDVHLGLGGMGDRVGAELNIRAGVLSAWALRSSASRGSNVLLHNNPSQSVAKGVVLVDELERGGRIGRAG